jgi:hypothetical protein
MADQLCVLRSIRLRTSGLTASLYGCIGQSAKTPADESDRYEETSCILLLDILQTWGISYESNSRADALQALTALRLPYKKSSHLILFLRL